MQALPKYVSEYSERFHVYRHNTVNKALQYIKGLLQTTRRNMEKMAESVPQSNEQALQQFLSDSPWDYQGVMDQVAGDANAVLGGADSVLLLDESSIVKKGEHSVGVARQWCGRLGKVDNCQVGVFAALARGSDVCLVNAQLYLPRSWQEDAKRCKKARVPREKQQARSKLDIALDLVRHARAIGLEYGWIGADSFYGRNKGFHQALDELGETFVLDVPKDFSVYLTDPRPKLPQAPEIGRQPCRYQSKQKAIEVNQWVNRQKTKTWRYNNFRMGAKGPMRVAALHRRVWVWDGCSAQAQCRHLLVRRDAGGEVKYSISNAPANTSVHRLLYMQGQRHFIERSFQDSKSHLGMDQYQARNWNSWHHHMALIMMAMVFILRERAVRKDSYPLLSVSDMVYVLATILPSRINNLEQALQVIEERHRKRQRDIDLKTKNYSAQQSWAASG